MQPEDAECPVLDAPNARIRATRALAVLLLLAGCGQPASPDVLNARVAYRMAPDHLCNKEVRVEYLPNGARISIPDSALFTIGRAEFTACGQYAMANAIEAMLSPGIMQVVIEPGGDIGASYAGLARQRADLLKGLLTKASFVPYQPPIAVQTNPTGTAGVWGVELMVANNS